LLCRCEVGLPPFRECIRLEPSDKRIRHLYREHLKGIWQPILLTDMHENLEETEGWVVGEIYDAPT
jgi:hypothetical protein